MLPLGADVVAAAEPPFDLPVVLVAEVEDLPLDWEEVWEEAWEVSEDDGAEEEPEEAAESDEARNLCQRDALPGVCHQLGISLLVALLNSIAPTSSTAFTPSNCGSSPGQAAASVESERRAATTCTAFIVRSVYCSKAPSARWKWLRRSLFTQAYGRAVERLACWCGGGERLCESVELCLLPPSSE